MTEKVKDVKSAICIDDVVPPEAYVEDLVFDYGLSRAEKNFHDKDGSPYHYVQEQMYGVRPYTYTRVNINEVPSNMHTLFKKNNWINRSIARSFEKNKKSITSVDTVYNVLHKKGLTLPSFVLQKAKNILYKFYNTEEGKKDRRHIRRQYYYASISLYLASSQDYPMYSIKFFIEALNDIFEQNTANINAKDYISSAKRDDKIFVNDFDLERAISIAKMSSSFASMLMNLRKEGIHYEIVKPVFRTGEFNQYTYKLTPFVEKVDMRVTLKSLIMNQPNISEQEKKISISIANCIYDIWINFPQKNHAMDICAIAYLSLMIVCDPSVRLIRRKSAGFIPALKKIAQKIGMTPIFEECDGIGKRVCNRVIINKLHPKMMPILEPSIKDNGVYQTYRGLFSGSTFEYIIRKKDNSHKIIAKFWTAGKRNYFNSASFEVSNFYKFLACAWRYGEFSFSDIKKETGLPHIQIERMLQLLKDLFLIQKMSNRKNKLRMHPILIVQHINNVFKDNAKGIPSLFKIQKSNIKMDGEWVLIDGQRVWFPKVKSIIRGIIEKSSVEDILAKSGITEKQLESITNVMKMIGIADFDGGKYINVVNDIDFAQEAFARFVAVESKI